MDKYDELGGLKVKYTKEQLKIAMFILLDDVLPDMECEKLKKEGNCDCDRCDECMFKQYIKKVKAGQLPKIITGKEKV